MQIDNIQIFKEGNFLFPIDGKYYSESEYLRSAIQDEKVRWLANLITHYRHNCIKSWNRMWSNGRRGAAYRSAANFGDYDEEKVKINERAKRQLIRKCYPFFLQAGIEVTHFTELQNTDWETIALANKFLEGKVEIPAYAEKTKKTDMPELTDNSLMPFGSHKGKTMANVPAGTLLWYYNNFTTWNESQKLVKEYIENNMEVLKQQAKQCHTKEK